MRAFPSPGGEGEGGGPDSRASYPLPAFRAGVKNMIDFSQDYFTLFGLPPRYRFDPDRLDLAYHALQREIHPDRYAAAGETERRLALQSSARVNEAYRALKDPVGRAQYLLSMRGIDALAEKDTELPGQFLESELERREAVADAHAGRDVARLGALLEQVRSDAAALEGSLADQLDAEAWEDARSAVRELRFLSKVAGDIEAALAEVEG
ncbi:MAG: Fe-S protein assembly co-chaperone HscB [Betaproteobacteria bacterium]|nr:MAG: Fe-S protein assembly co-chaperone HscB [Betaproteobacteria bacterium]